MFSADQLLNIAFSFEYFNLYELREIEQVQEDDNNNDRITMLYFITRLEKAVDVEVSRLG